jgi:hypothetical protein
MDGARFDRLTRTLRSRRTAVSGLLGGGLAVLLGLATPEETDAHTYLARCKQIKHGERRRACLRRARAHNRTCHSQPTTTTCAGRCGVWTNNCGRAVSCPACAAPTTCLDNGSCGQVCSPAAVGTCSTGCDCRYTSTDGATYCTTTAPGGPGAGFACELVPQACSATTACLVGAACMITACGPGLSRADRCVPLCPR